MLLIVVAETCVWAPKLLWPMVYVGKNSLLYLLIFMVKGKYFYQQTAGAGGYEKAMGVIRNTCRKADTVFEMLWNGSLLVSVGAY